MNHENYRQRGLRGLASLIPMGRKPARGPAEMRREESGLVHGGSGTSALTLIELLVVIAIIAMLAALLLPKLNRAKASARSAVCKSNLKQIGTALRLYVDEFEKYPMWGNGGTKSWERDLAPYCGGIQDGTSYESPSALFVCQFSGPYAYNWLGTSFGLGSAFGRAMVGDGFLGLGGSANNGMGSNPADNLALPESRVLVPTDMIAIGDGVEVDLGLGVIAGFGWPGVQWPQDRPHAQPNASFCDGHVESSNSGLIPTSPPNSQTWAPTFKPDELHAKRWNNDNQPHPETWPGAGP
ncbi:MAG: type II secretion system protein [Verrucomicrobiota bacterium]|jgi:prepilin-type N-terminal cleavage/methylation domain-containing protein/prepilin-type processing-associated H-X9-DG protein